MVIVNNEKKYLAIDKIVENDIILVRNSELIPADAVLKKSKAIIDYSYITGEY